MTIENPFRMVLVATVTGNHPVVLASGWTVVDMSPTLAAGDQRRCGVPRGLSAVAEVEIGGGVTAPRPLGTVPDAARAANAKTLARGYGASLEVAETDTPRSSASSMARASHGPAPCTTRWYPRSDCRTQVQDASLLPAETASRPRAHRAIGLFARHALDAFDDHHIGHPRAFAHGL